MSKRDYYDILGLNSGCEAQEIKKKYRNLALKWHPDKQANKKEASSKFNEIHEAYTVLMDSNQRQIYDNYGHAGLQEFKDNVVNPPRENIFLKKGFQGTDKSAFEVLLDILKERDDESESELFNNKEEQKDFKSEFASLFGEHFQQDDEDQFDFFKNYTPTFQDPNFMFNCPLFNQKEDQDNFANNQSPKRQDNSKQNSSQPTRADSQRQKFDNATEKPLSSGQFFNFDNYYKDQNNTYNSADAPILIVDDKEEDNETNDCTDSDFQSDASYKSFGAQLNEFQSFLDDFHKTIEDNIERGHVNSSSKKIFKREKNMKPHFISKKEQSRGYNMSSVPIIS